MRDPLENLTATEKKIVEAFLNGLTFREIADKLGVSIRTVYKAVYKYRRNLREMGRHEEAEKLKRRGRRPKIEKKAVLSREASLDKIASKAIYDVLYEYTRKIIERGIKAIDKEECDGSDIYSKLNEIVQLLNAINENIIKMLNAISKIETVKTYETRTIFTGETEKLSFLIDNPWLEVLKSRKRKIN
ncbi:MAG: hypothetical protein B6U94_01970 [Thermofilum sp. ex4484_79]|nr:MAG: hypothetical protein B6U94_01970 [Thermofilum sp. ex4484_79]